MVFNIILHTPFVYHAFFATEIRIASGMSSNVGSQTRWDNQLGVFRTSPGENAVQSRVAQTAALVHFSKIIGYAKRLYFIKNWFSSFISLPCALSNEKCSSFVFFSVQIYILFAKRTTPFFTQWFCTKSIIVE